MKKIFKFLISEKFLVVFFSLFYLLLAYGPLLYQFLAPLPSGKIFLGSFGFPPDFWGNIISFQQGRLGHWLFVPKITSTLSTPPTFLKMEYLFLGQLNRIIPLPPIIFFHLSRVALTVVLLAMSYALISRLFKTKIERLTALALALFATSFGPNYQNLILMWSPVSVFQRLAYYPHYLFGFIFVLLAIMTLSSALENRNLKKLALASLFGFLTSWIHAGNTVTLFLSFPFYFLLIIIDAKKTKKNLKQLIYKPVYLFVFGLLSSIPMLYIYQISHAYPWNLLSKIDLKMNMSEITPIEHFVAGIGPTLLLGLLGSYFIYKKKDDLSRLILPWSFTYLLGFWFVWRALNYNGNRFLQTPFFIMLGILTTVFFREISRKIFTKNLKAQNQLMIGLVALTIVISFPAAKLSWNINKENFSWLGNYLYYSKPENLAAMDWLAKNTKENDICLADKVNAELISALAGNYCYITVHATELDNFYELENNIRMFYQQTDSQAAQKFLKTNNIKYILWADKERILSEKQDLNYPFLTKVFSFENAVVYRFQ